MYLPKPLTKTPASIATGIAFYSVLINSSQYENTYTTNNEKDHLSGIPIPNFSNPFIRRSHKTGSANWGQWYCGPLLLSQKYVKSYS